MTPAERRVVRAAVRWFNCWGYDSTLLPSERRLSRAVEALKLARKTAAKLRARKAARGKGT